MQFVSQRLGGKALSAPGRPVEYELAPAADTEGLNLGLVAELLDDLCEPLPGIAPQFDLAQQGVASAARERSEQERGLAIVSKRPVLGGKNLRPVWHQRPSQQLSSRAVSLLFLFGRYLASHLSGGGQVLAPQCFK